MLTIAAALLAAQPAAPRDPPRLGRTAWLVATIGHSEWCPAGNVRLDLVSGQYQVTAGLLRRSNCNSPATERPSRAGRLAAAPLAGIRAAFQRVLAEGAESDACQAGRSPEEIIISNGGTPVLVLTTGRATASAPDELSCWTRAARDLHRQLDRAFPSRLPR